MRNRRLCPLTQRCKAEGVTLDSAKAFADRQFQPQAPKYPALHVHITRVADPWGHVRAQLTNHHSKQRDGRGADLAPPYSVCARPQRAKRPAFRDIDSTVGARGQCGPERGRQRAPIAYTRANRS